MLDAGQETLPLFRENPDVNARQEHQDDIRMMDVVGFSACHVNAKRHEWPLVQQFLEFFRLHGATVGQSIDRRKFLLNFRVSPGILRRLA